MASVTGTGSSLDTAVFRFISTLTTAEINTLKTDYSINPMDDIAVLEKDDFDEILGTDGSTFMKRRRLQTMARFLRNGGKLDASTTMETMIAQANVHASAPTTTPLVSTPSTTHPIKLSPSDIPAFTGDIGDQEKYKTTIEAMVGQTAFKFLLSRDATTSVEEERDEELFNVFKASFLEGTAYHLITSLLEDEDGHTLKPSGRRVWLKFKTWCNSGGRKDTLRSRLKADIEALRLDGDTTDGFEYVNLFITKYNELKNVGGAEDPSQMMSKFVEHIEDEDFSVTKELLQGILLQVDRKESALNTQEFYDMVETRQRALNQSADREMAVKSRRQHADLKRKRNDSFSSLNSNESSINPPSIDLNLP